MSTKKKSKKPTRCLVDVQDYVWLRAKSNTLNAMGHGNGPLCPSCGQYVLVRGYVCFGCGFDPSRKD